MLPHASSPLPPSPRPSRGRREPFSGAATSRSSARGIAILLLPLALALTFSTGCATRPEPGVRFHRDGSITTYKRYELFPRRDFFHRFLRKAYSPPRESDLELAVRSEARVLEQFGPPDYVRKPFRSLQGERVNEWVYLDHQRIYQFVEGDLVFDGDLTDLEQLLIRHGYPDHSVVTVSDSGLVRNMFHYVNRFGSGRGDIYSLADDWIVASLEGN